MRYLESLTMLESNPRELEQMCEPLFLERLYKGWQELKTSNASDMTLLNKREDNLFKLSLVSFTYHFNGYLDRYTDIRSKNQLISFDGVDYRYRCRWPYKNYIEASSRFILRVETDLKLNLTMHDESSATSTDLLDVADKEMLSQPEVHYIMFEGLTQKNDMGLLGFLKMLWKQRRRDVLPIDGRW